MNNTRNATSTARMYDTPDESHTNVPHDLPPSVGNQNW